MSTRAKVLLTLLAVVVFVMMGIVTVIALEVTSFLDSRPSDAHDERIIEIPKGASVMKIGQTLEEQGVLTSARKFSYLVRFKKAVPKIKAGEFRFFTDLTPAEVLEVLIKGEEVTYSVTFPEGTRIVEMKTALEKIPFLNGDTFAALALDKGEAQALQLESPTLEGFLFPSTYHLTRRMSERDLLKWMVKTFKDYWTPEKEARAKELGMTRLEVVTLASIIEKESAAEAERPIVSSVYHNRLKANMKLQADPTIIYGLPNYDGNIRRADISNPHPWNTYVHTGLPPTPIASPGKGSLEAALYPTQTSFLYFVARPDHTHDFSTTYAEHARKVYQYQIAPGR